MSCNPLEAKDPDLPPAFSGYSIADRGAWDDFRAEHERTHKELWQATNEWVIEQGAPPLPDMEFIHESSNLNLYLYPEVADYPRSRPLGDSWKRLESSVRATEKPFTLPPSLDGEGSLVYLSLGSLGSADVDLMKRLVEVLATTPHRYVVSKGPRADEFELADNMWGEDRLPQTSIIPLADLVITHGGNNTVTESLHIGKPMIEQPLFWDQYDSAQRVADLGFGIRLGTYSFEDRELSSAVGGLLANRKLRAEMVRNAAAIRDRGGTRVAADLIEEVSRRQPW